MDSRSVIRHLLSVSRANMTLYETVGNLTRAIELSNGLEQVTMPDREIHAGLCHVLGDVHFNARRFLEAGIAYAQGIQIFQGQVLDQNQIRTIIRLQINLADACIELGDIQQAESQVNEGMVLFRMLRPEEMTTSERLLTTNFNVISFKAHYDKEVSTAKYLNTTQFVQHQSILHATHEDNNLARSLETVSLQSPMPAAAKQGILRYGQFTPPVRPAEAPETQLANDLSNLMLRPGH